MTEIIRRGDRNDDSNPRNLRAHFEYSLLHDHKDMPPRVTVSLIHDHIHGSRSQLVILDKQIVIHEPGVDGDKAEGEGIVKQLLTLRDELNSLICQVEKDLDLKPPF